MHFCRPAAYPKHKPRSSRAGLTRGTAGFSGILISALLLMLAGAQAAADIPNYELEVVAGFSTNTNLRGYSENGWMVGDQVVAGQGQPFVASVEDGLRLLPLPTGFDSGAALDVNNNGIIVGTVSDDGFAFDRGQPAFWTPDGAGGWTVTIPEQFETVPSPVGELAVNGGQIVAVNELGLMVGWSRFQGFQGGPTTLFSASEPPLNLGEMGFAATVRAINNNNVIAGGEILLNLDTGALTEIGVPAPIDMPGFTNAIAFAINDENEAVVAANLASVPTENWLTYIYNSNQGYTRLNPEQLPSRFVGFYDNNNRGDVSASGGLLFRDEGVLVDDVNTLLEPEFSEWQVSRGFIANDRSLYTTAFNNTTDTSAIVKLSPVTDMIFDSGFETGEIQ